MCVCVFPKYNKAVVQPIKIHSLYSLAYVAKINFILFAILFSPPNDIGCKL